MQFPSDVAANLIARFEHVFFSTKKQNQRNGDETMKDHPQPLREQVTIPSTRQGPSDVSGNNSHESYQKIQQTSTNQESIEEMESPPCSRVGIALVCYKLPDLAQDLGSSNIANTQAFEGAFNQEKR